MNTYSHMIFTKFQANSYFFYASVYVLGCLLFVDNQFFWDTIQLGSKHAHFYFNNGLKWEFLPEEFNSGHIPAFGYYLACCWILLGKTLIVSHLAMLPFIILFLVFIKKVVVTLQEEGRSVPLLGFVVLTLDPTLISQCSLVSPDIVLLAFLLILIYGMLSAKQVYTIIGSIGLCLISIRGMYCCGLLLCYSMVTGKHFIKTVSAFLPALYITGMYYVLHYLDVEWVGVHEDSPWKASLTLTSVRMVTYNIGLIGWRLLDFGRVVWWLALLVYLVWKSDTKALFGKVEIQLALLFLLGFILLTAPFVSLTAHRYYLPVIVLMLISIVLLVANSPYFSNGRKQLIYSCIIASQLIGHCILYPPFVSQGWDSSLRYLPALDLFEQVDNYIIDSQIDCSDIGTLFPLRGNVDYRNLQENGCVYSTLDLSENKYVVYSNVMNDFTEKDLQYLRANWKESMRWSSLGIECILFKK